MQKIFVIACATLLACAVKADATRQGAPCSGRVIKYVAHRGDYPDVPEGSMAAYRNAVSRGSEIVKLDVHPSKDGVIVLSHDPSFKRTMGWDVKIADVSWDEIQRHTYLFHGRPTQEKAVSLPMALETVKSIPEFWIDFKHFDPDFCERTLAEFAKAGISRHRIMVATYTQPALRYMKARHPDIRRIGHMSFGLKDGKWLPSFGHGKGGGYAQAKPGETFAPEVAESILSYAAEMGLWGVNMISNPRVVTKGLVAHLKGKGLWVSIAPIHDAKLAKEFVGYENDCVVTGDRRTVKPILDQVASCASPAIAFKAFVPVDWTCMAPQKGVEELRKLYGYGYRRFVLITPWCKRYCDRADVAAYEQSGRDIAYAKEALKDLPDVEIGWWLAPSMGSSRDFPGQRVMDSDGKVTSGSCPLSDEFTEALCARVEACVRIARPSVMFVEDDYTLSNHGGMNRMKGCFCPLHIAEYAKRTGHAYTAKEIAEMFRNPTADNESKRKAFADLSRDSLARLASRIRAAIDKVDPSIRVCLCQSAFVDLDGDSTEAVARAFAGGTRPMVRIFGSGYFAETPSMIPCSVAHAVWSAQHLPSDIELLHETDPYPHTRFYNSSLYLISELSAAVMAGVDGTYYYCTQYNDDPLGDPGYALRLKSESRRLEEVRRIRATMRPCGVRMVYDPAEVYMFRETKKGPAKGMLSVGAYFLSKMGFPMVSVKDASAALLIGTTPNALSDAELERILSGGALLDSEAAMILAKRGFGDMIGCDVEEQPADMVYDCEKILPAAGCRARGKILYNRSYAGWIPMKSVSAKLSPRSGAEEWSALFDIDGRKVAPATLFFRNKKGGRVGVMSRALDTSPHPSIYSERKQELLANLFAKISEGSLDVCAPATPGTWIMSARNDREMLVMAENLCGEPRDDFVLRFSSEWAGAAVSRIETDGTRRNLGTASTDFRLPAGSLQPMTPEFFVVARPVAANDVRASRRLEIVREIEKDDYESNAVRSGNPKIVRGDIAPGLLVSTGKGVYRTAGSVDIVPARRHKMPAAGEFLASGIRLYGFGENDSGRLCTAFARGNDKFMFTLKPEANGIACELSEGGRFSVDKTALPADFVFSASADGAYDLTITSLADSRAQSFSGTLEFFRGATDDVSRAISLVSADGRNAEVTIDNVSLSVARAEGKATIAYPYTAKPLPEFDPVKAGWPLVFSDEFDGTQVDKSKWSVSYGKPEDRVRVEDGLLKISTGYVPGSTNKLETSGLWSVQKFLYGYFEARVKFTTYNGWWSAFWLCSRTPTNPFLDGMEIDIFEDYYMRNPGRNKLDHNLHIKGGGNVLKSWNYNSILPRTHRDWYTIGCKWTPFEVTYYLDGKVIPSRAKHSPYRTVTFDAFRYGTTIVPLHAIVSGQIMKVAYGKHDPDPSEVYPEIYEVDYVRIYGYPGSAPGASPEVELEGNDNANAYVATPGTVLEFKAKPRPAAKSGARIKAVHLFDNGFYIATRTEPPYDFTIPFTEEYFSRTVWAQPGRSKACPKFKGASHMFCAFAEDENDEVGYSRTIQLMFAATGESRPFQGKAAVLPGVIKPGRYDEGGQGIAYNDITNTKRTDKPWRPDEWVGGNENVIGSVQSGEWLKYTVDVKKAGRYGVKFHYGTPLDYEYARVELVLDGKHIGTLGPLKAHKASHWTHDTLAETEVVLPAGRHVLLLSLHGVFNFGDIEFVECE